LLIHLLLTLRIDKLTIVAALAAASLLSGCATLPPGSKPDPRDRFERANRSVYAFNKAVDHAVLRPVARAYVKVTPRPVRRGISNFLANIDYPITIINDALQGKVHDSLRDVARFGINTVVGVGGLFDPATHWGFEKHDEDFGQTLGKWGVSSGPYLMLPIFGPSTVRDAPAKVVDHFTSPKTYLLNTNEDLAVSVVGVVDKRAGLLDTDHLIDSAYDPYAFLRNAWLQRREYQVRDGKVPPDEELKDDSDQSTPGKEPDRLDR
jgi:phospholipid-binding lipoprotein MlaA